MSALSFEHARVVRGVLAGVSAAVIWSGWYVLARYGVTQGGMDAYDLAALRFLVAAPILLALVRRFPVPRNKWFLIVMMTIGIGPAFVIVVSTGFLLVPATFGGAMTAVFGVVFSLLGGQVVLKEKLTRLQFAGVAITLTGLLALASTVDSRANIGYFMTGGLLWACYGVSFRRSGLSAIQGVASVAVLSAIFYLPPYFWFTGARVFNAPVQELVLQGLGQGVFTAIVALALHTRAVVDLGATKSALFQSLVPPFTLILSAVFLGEASTPLETAAIAVILLGVYIALRYRS